MFPAWENAIVANFAIVEPKKKIGECSMVGPNHTKYHGGGICCIVIYYGILYNIYIYIYIYIYMIWFGWVYGISTIVGYLMPNKSLYIYIKYI